MNYIFTQIVLANPESQYCDSSHFPTQTSAQASSNIKSTISFELLDLDKKIQKTKLVRIKFPTELSQLLLHKSVFLYEVYFNPISPS